MYKDLSPSEKFVFEWQYRLAGGFDTMLAHLFCKADAGNFARLALAFPEEAEGMSSYLHDAGWWEHVQRKGLEGVKTEEELMEHRKAHISEKPPEWALEFAQTLARMAFGNMFTRGEWAKMILPTTDVNDAIAAVSPSVYQEWHN